MKYDDVVIKVKSLIHEEEVKLKNAKDRIDKKYHQYLSTIEENVAILPFAYNQIGKLQMDFPDRSFYAPDPEKAKKPKTYMKVTFPYLEAEGMVIIFTDWYEDIVGKKERLFVKFASDVIDGKYPHVKSIIELKIFDESGTISERYAEGLADITEKNKQSRVKIAQTSSVRRAIVFLGRGLIGSGNIAKDEMDEMINDISETGETELTDEKPPAEPPRAIKYLNGDGVFIRTESKGKSYEEVDKSVLEKCINYKTVKEGITYAISDEDKELMQARIRTIEKQEKADENLNSSLSKHFKGGDDKDDEFDDFGGDDGFDDDDIPF